MSGPLHRLAVVAVTAGVAALGAGCGQGFDRVAAVESFRDANPEVTGDQAGCVVDGLIERYGLDGLAVELEAGTEQSPAFTEAQFREMFTCGVQGDVVDELTEQLEASGVAAEQAPCVAQGLAGELTDGDIDVLLSGNITDEFMAKFVAAMETCGAVDG